MEAILKYNLDEVDDKCKHLAAIKAMDMASVIWDMDQWLRQKLKYEELSEEQDFAYQKTRDALHEILSEHSVDLDSIMY